jgi:serine/threonine protein kinase
MSNETKVDAKTEHATRQPANAGRTADQPVEQTVTDWRSPPTPSLDPSLTDTASGGNQLGLVIAGRYHLVGILGEGGMGTVYVADQTEPIRRRVALKLIKAGMDSRGVVARFNAERQALALMDHPNIARVYDAGSTPAGQPYFVMELVQGQTLTAFADEHRLDLRTRLELFVPICQAVQHAHQKGVIHRDLKPGNVLVMVVDGRPTPKVIDFGVAKAMDQKLTDLSFVDVGAIVGTPAYMSPEQADPATTDIDTRTDVYSLGVMLYELLVGSPPIDPRTLKRGALLEMLRMIRESDPPRPSTRLSAAPDRPTIAANRATVPDRLAQSLRGELDWVVMKALEKDRDRRYVSPLELARDIQRHLADEMVEARPPNRGYRLRKFVRRNRGAVITATAVAAALLAGIVSTSLSLVEVRHQKEQVQKEFERAESEMQRAEAEMKRAQENFATARHIILDMGTRVNQLETGQTNPALVDEARLKLLNAAREQFEKFLAKSTQDSQLQSQMALLHRYAGNVNRFSGANPDVSLEAYDAAIRIYKILAAREPNVARHLDSLAQTLADRATVEKRSGKLKVALASLGEAEVMVDRAKDRLRPSHVKRSMGLIHGDFADVHHRLGDAVKAEQRAAAAFQCWEELMNGPALERVETDALFSVIALQDRAQALREFNRPAEARATQENAATRMAKLVTANAHRDIRFWSCEVRRERARDWIVDAAWRAEAEKDLDAVIDEMRKLVEEYPHVPFYRDRLANALVLKAEMLLTARNLTAARAEMDKAMAVTEELLIRFGNTSDSNQIRARAFLMLGTIHAADNRPEPAAKSFQSAMNLFNAGLKLDPDNALHTKGLAEAQQQLARVKK